MNDQTLGKHHESTQQSIEMLRAVIDGETYESVAARFGVTRTAVERRVKALAIELTVVVGVHGLKEEGAAFVSRLRQHRDSIHQALANFEPRETTHVRPARVLSEAEMNQGAVRIKGRTNRTWHDLALYRILFATGLRPLEVARLQVHDYLEIDGGVRRRSELRADAAINGKVRPLWFNSVRLDEVLLVYLEERRMLGHGLGLESEYRGLDPYSPLFLSLNGEPYRILSNNEAPGQNRQVCRPILEIYRKLFRYAELKGLSAQSARLTVMSRMYERGADEDQVGFILGICERSAVRELMPKPRRSFGELTANLG